MNYEWAKKIGVFQKKSYGEDKKIRKIENAFESNNEIKVTWAKGMESFVGTFLIIKSLYPL